MLERELEAILVRCCRERNVKCLKWVSPSEAGVPDRILIGPDGRVGFVELKRPGGKLTPLQARFADMLLARSAFYRTVDSLDKIHRALDELLS